VKTTVQCICGSCFAYDGDLLSDPDCNYRLNMWRDEHRAHEEPETAFNHFNQQSTDAREWAIEFLRKYANRSIRPNLKPEDMVPWFAKAIEAGRSATSKDYQTRYAQLIFAVSRKFHNETRHQTALRYIREADAKAGGTASKDCAKAKAGSGWTEPPQQEIPRL